MATTISSKFTGADRRKRVVTYGKSSRIESPMPPPVNEAASESAPSPERPRKQSGTGNSLKRPGGTLKASSTLGNTRATTSAPDIFDVPSDDDFGVPTVIKPTKKLVSKTAATAKKAPAETFDIPASNIDTSGPSRQSVKPLQPLRKPSQPPASVPKKLQKAAKVEIPPPVEPLAPQQRRGRTPQPTKKPEQTLKSTTSQPVHPVAKPKAVSRGTTPAPSAPPTTNTAKKLKSTSTLPAKKVAEKPSLKQTSDADIFDFPPSDNEAPLLSPRPARPLPLSRTKQSAKLGTSSTSKALVSPRELGESDDSNEQKKRKRQVTAAVPVPTETRERKRDPSVPQRNRKYQKKEDSVSPGHEADKRSGALSPVEAEIALPKVNKPRRTRLRTEPNKFRPAMAKRQSSPARLHNMLPVRSLSKPSPVVEVPEAAPVEDETMYDIPDADATPVPAARTTLSGTVTPRQKAFFSGLLGNSSQASPSMPSISKLMLTDRKPGDLAASLRRSVSDVSPSVPSRKSRLIDSLKQADETSEDEGSDSNDEEEDEEGEEDVTIIAGVATSSESNKNDQNASADGHEHMEIDSERATKSQASQGRVGQAFNSKLTYAKQRSYLEETNPEDALLLSMDIDDDLGFSSQRRDVFSEDDEDPASQVRGIHDLRRQGQHEKFQTEAQFWIDDISNNSKSNASIRRSSMMELTTKMADDKFIGQLLDSALAHQLFQNISSNGEIIFDFAATVATLFILQTKPGYNVLDQLHQCNIIATLTKLLEFELDIQRIAKDRKTNLAKRAQESVSDFRKLVQDSPVWSPDKPDKVSPQVVALKALELLTLGLRKAGGADTLIGQETVIKLVNIASNAYQRTKSGKGTSQDRLLLGIILSVLEAVSVSQQRQVVWPNHVLHSLADLLPVFFEFDQSAQIMLTVKLCMNLTNNKPKACASFSESAFVQPLIRAINDRFTLLGTELIEEQRTEARESLILSLGAMINLAEFSDQARINVVVDGDELIDPLVKNFLLWSERAAQADSMEESQSTVAVGYLAVMLGNLCLNKTIRSKVRTGLPDQDMGMLIDKIKEFVRFHEHIDRKSRAFEGAEGRATLQNYTARLMQVVEGLEEAEA